MFEDDGDRCPSCKIPIQVVGYNYEYTNYRKWRLLCRSICTVMDMRRMESL